MTIHVQPQVLNFASLITVQSNILLIHNLMSLLSIVTFEYRQELGLQARHRFTLTDARNDYWSSKVIWKLKSSIIIQLP